MSGQGVPMDEVTATDHIQVRAALVRRLGGANQALVWARIYYRADEKHRAATEKDGRWWWQASYGALAEETGLTEKQARAAVDDLLAGGFLDRRPGTGRAFMYRPITHAAYLPSGADSPIEVSAQEGSSIRPGGQMYLPQGAVTPLIDIEDEVDTPIVPTAESVDDLFESAWAVWPKRTEKKLSRERFGRALAKRPQLLDDVIRFGLAYAATTEVQFVPALAVWIGRERWDDDLPVARGGKPGTVDSGRQADAILRARDAERRAIAS